MRFQEFRITEAAIDKKKYWDPESPYAKTYQQSVKDIIDAGGPLYVNKDTKVYFKDDASKAAALQVINSYDEWKDSNRYPTITATTEDGEEISFTLNKIEKKFKTGKGDDAVTAVTVNVGNVTEGVLGLAIAAKFSNTSRTISEEDVLELGRRFVESGQNTISVNVADRTDDNLQLKITVPAGDTKALHALIENNGDGKKVQKQLGLSDAAGAKLDSLFKKCTNYANSGEAPKEAVMKIQEYYQDNVKQTIEVVSDGAESENQNMTKVDLKLLIDGDKTEVLSLLSLKAGSGRSQIGQSSGKPFSNLRLFWRQNFNYELPAEYENKWTELYKDLANEKGKVPVTKESTKAIMNGPIRATYDWAAEKISRHLAGDRTEGEISFLEHLQQGLLFHSGKNIDPENRQATATKGDENVIVTIIDFGKTNDFVEMRFAEPFYNIMTYFDLESTGVTTAEGGNGMQIQVIVRPNKERLKDDQTPEEIKSLAAKLGSGKVLVQYRSYIQQGTTIRNIVEVDKGAKILGALSNEQFKIAKAIEKQPEVEPQPTQEPTQAPADQTKQTNDPNATV